MPLVDNSREPQVVRERFHAVVIAALICLMLPVVVLLVVDHAADAERFWVSGWLAGGFFIALGVAKLYWGPYRALGLAPLGSLVELAAVGHGVYWQEWPGWVHGAAVGLMVGGLVRGRRWRESKLQTIVLLAAVGVGVGVAYFLRQQERPLERGEWFVLVAAGVVTVAAWVGFFRPVFELVLEPVVWILYRVRWSGPGFVDFPRTGPCLVIANHACWLDPIFLAKVLPRPITPMMTARFYDLPLLRWLMVAFGVIRVPEKTFKKDAPEIHEAVAALDRGECLVIFPEGYLRRTESRPLRRFGQGVWQILKARPQTPVYAVWIDGGWGSFTSYYNGPPTKNKRLDLRRPIRVGMSAPVRIPADVLENHWATRTFLMNLVGEARRHFGLEPLPTFTLPPVTDDNENSEDVEDTPRA
ncbi:MAG: lysophospholipid acyltransferase family protein [Gemmataceae bacterium]|nr:1-acyl-sn-glycerol-3-phosphate acyltransferase [Gemmata sp.]MDW8198586.1 lysophospholipid acyltransferase family protein [Gemmataceae bacterium]